MEGDENWSGFDGWRRTIAAVNKGNRGATGEGVFDQSIAVTEQSSPSSFRVQFVFERHRRRSLCQLEASADSHYNRGGFEEREAFPQLQEKVL